MRGVGFYKYGGPEVLEEVEMPDPKPDPEEVVVRVISTSMNRIDTLVRLGYHGLKLDMPHLPGTDLVGEVESVGSKVKGISQGELVTANTIFGCGKCRECIMKDEPLCSQWKMIGLQTNCTYGELIKIPASVVYKPPRGMAIDDIAAMPLSLSLSWKAIRSIGKGRNGDVVVIRGISGNVGIFSTMIAKALKMKVIGLSRQDSNKQKKLRNIGADLIIDSSLPAQKIKKEVFDFTDGIGADLVIESAGGTLGDSIDLARHGGKILLFGTISGTESTINVPPFYLRSVSVIGMHNANYQEFTEAFQFARKNKIRPIIAKTMAIKNAKEAHIMLHESKTFGKIILQNKW